MTKCVPLNGPEQIAGARSQIKEMPGSDARRAMVVRRFGSLRAAVVVAQRRELRAVATAEGTSLLGADS